MRSEDPFLTTSALKKYGILNVWLPSLCGKCTVTVIKREDFSMKTELLFNSLQEQIQGNGSDGEIDWDRFKDELNHLIFCAQEGQAGIRKLKGEYSSKLGRFDSMYSVLHDHATVIKAL